MRGFTWADGIRASLSRWTAVVVLATSTNAIPIYASAQTWNYQSNLIIDGRISAPGHITLENRDGRNVLIMAAGNLNICYQGLLDVEVTRSEATTTIAIPPKLIGCEEVRFVIKNDGTGGRRETKRGANWAWDRFERNLTLRK
jgi:hypothetical protein